MEYEKLVLKAIEHLSKITFYKSEIAKLALNACDIRHGGRSGNLYTLTDFADDIGVNRKTLSNWVETQRTINIIGIKNPSKEEFTKANRATDYIRIQRRVKNKIDGTIKSKKEFGKVVSTKEVKRIFNSFEESKETGLSIDFVKIVARLKSIVKNQDFYLINRVIVDEGTKDIAECLEILSTHSSQ